MLRIATVLFVALSLAPLAFADDIKVANDGDAANPRVDCDVTDCDYYSMTVGMLLPTDTLQVFGPLTTVAGDPITTVVLELDIVQTWVGDLVAYLYYDEDGNGTYDYGPVAALCRPGISPCTFPDGCCGCSGNISGIYTFGDDALEPLGDPNCPTDILPGCFLPDPETIAGFAATFGGAATGGDFWLEIGDAAAGDDTTLNGWGVYVCGGTTATEQTTWGAVKQLYR